MYVTASGAVARLRQLEIVANNLANSETAGFKADRAVFHAALESLLTDPRGIAVPGGPVRTFVQTQFVLPDFRAGSVAKTGSPLDVAIQGPGFFEVETPNGLRYTRAGTFAVNTNQELATPDGFPVQGEGGAIQVGTAAARILSSGEVQNARGQVVGRLKLVDFDTPKALVKEGLNLFVAPSTELPQPIADPSFLEGMVERSNVQTVRELSTLILLQRAFESSMQILQADDQATESLIREVSP